jgi:hypothetical protein
MAMGFSVSSEIAIGEMTFENAEDGPSIRLDMENVNARFVTDGGCEVTRNARAN